MVFEDTAFKLKQKAEVAHKLLAICLLSGLIGLFEV